MLDKKIRLALIGLGKMGISHLSIAGANPHVEIVGVCDTSKMVLTFLEKQTPFSVYDDYKKMIDEAKPQAVILSVPTKYHAGMIEGLLDKNIHVFAEKPLTLDAATSQKLAEKAEVLGLINQVGYHNHFIGTFLEMKRLLQKNILGDVYHFTAEAYGPVVTKAKDSTWRSKQEEGGGCLYDYASHVIDLVNFSLSEIVGVSGVELKKIFSKEVEDAVYGTLHLKSGISGILSVNWSDPTYRKMSTKLTVFGKNGKIIADATELKMNLNEPIKGGSYDRGWTTISVGTIQEPVGFYLRGEEYTAQLDYFISSIQNGIRSSQHNFRQGAKTDHAIALIRKAIH